MWECNLLVAYSEKGTSLTCVLWRLGGLNSIQTSAMVQESDVGVWFQIQACRREIWQWRHETVEQGPDIMFDAIEGRS